MRANDAINYAEQGCGITITRGIEGKQRYLSEIISFIGERVPLDTDNMLTVGATESGAVFEQFPGFLERVSVEGNGGMNIFGLFGRDN